MPTIALPNVSRRVHRLLAIACASALFSGTAQAMPVSEFLSRVEAIQAKGMMAMFQLSEIRALTAAGEDAGNSWRADIKAANDAGRPPRACPPADLKVGKDEFLGMLRAVPVAERSAISVRDQFGRAMDKRYPCPHR